eukprot:scaffold2277_cov256-Pinguiococcus_pyrenoidosus.AAC.16
MSSKKKTTPSPDFGPNKLFVLLCREVSINTRRVSAVVSWLKRSFACSNSGRLLNISFAKWPFPTPALPMRQIGFPRRRRCRVQKAVAADSGEATKTSARR